MKKYSYSYILLHGFSMEGDDMEYYQNKIQDKYPKERIRFIKPNASCIQISIYDNDRYNSWYDYYTPNCDKEPLINEGQLLKNRSRIHRILRKEINYHNDPEKVFLVGMSQGCCMALDAGLTFPKKIGGIIGFKGHIIHRTYTDFKKNQRVWVCHGKKDRTIFYDFAKASYDRMKKKNKDIFLLTQNCNHSIPSGIINQMKSIQRHFV